MTNWASYREGMGKKKATEVTDKIKELEDKNKKLEDELAIAKKAATKPEEKPAAK